jgi:hypothetical protein
MGVSFYGTSKEIEAKEVNNILAVFVTNGHCCVEVANVGRGHHPICIDIFLVAFQVMHQKGSCHHCPKSSL